MTNARCAVWATAKTKMTPAYHSAYILHSRPFQDDKLLLDLLLQAGGRCRVVARRPSKKKGGRSQWPLFTLYQLQLTGRGELKTVSSLEEVSAGWQLQAEFLFSALYLNELICRIWPADVHSDDLFGLYQHTLQALVRNQGNPAMLEPILREFEFAILTELGIALDCTLDANGDAICADGFYQWQHEQGFVRAMQGFSGLDLLAMSQRHWQAQSLRAAKQLTRMLLKPLLGAQPLMSRSLFSQLTSQASSNERI